MILAKVVGTVVSSSQDFGIDGVRFLLLQKCNQRGKLKEDYFVAMDMVQAGYEEMVIVSQSSAARETPLTTDKPVDALIVGIVDSIDEEEEIVYNK